MFNERITIQDLEKYFALEYELTKKDIERLKDNPVYSIKEIVTNAQHHMLGAISFCHYIGFIETEMQTLYEYWYAELDKLLD